MEDSTKAPQLFAAFSVYLPEHDRLPSLRALLLQHGAMCVGPQWHPTMNLVVVSSLDALPEGDHLFQTIRSAEVPVVSSLWVVHSVKQGRLHAVHAPYALYDPRFLRGVVVTTTQLPMVARYNVRDAVQYYGGRYSPALTSDTTLLIHDGVSSKKLAAAIEAGVQVESLEWLQRGLDRGYLLAPSSPHAADLALLLLDELICLLPARSVTKRPREGEGSGAVHSVTEDPPAVSRGLREGAQASWVTFSLADKSDTVAVAFPK
jgi:hypothetical protein